ncbi:MAG: hypothetical protein R2844_06535 [Caldilineales bacterium]
MPIITRLYVRTSLVYLIAALTLAVLLALSQVVALPAALRAAGPVYFHLFLVGWVTQLIMGIVFDVPQVFQERPRGSEDASSHHNLRAAKRWPAAASAGRAGRAVNEGRLWSWALVLSAVLQWLAGVFFVANTWGRVKER